jgi:hypothetical protein
MMEALSSTETSFIQEPHDLTSQTTVSFCLMGSFVETVPLTSNVARDKHTDTDAKPADSGESVPVTLAMRSHMIKYLINY